MIITEHFRMRFAERLGRAIDTEVLKDRICACTTIAQVDDAARAMTRKAKAHEARDTGGIAQLRNLITYQRMSISRGWASDHKDLPS